ncbi:hypothetical protein BU26DRAFT_268078 [Trematosphaeria pertusa]|uniref:NACHT domain-containing protein n=1 Tax=Trematosphaeria pertusa TaxID=390896 RepID=A0A6A6IMF4_9PLEO|nr:uncharacterized protein BU26DRAFT_268078 [Trematosphaeria pertusa]KAF2250663.1 hypothetical protein BU26DRAFT_268078 [Trematosphaeria pertusa]
MQELDQAHLLKIETILKEAATASYMYNKERQILESLLFETMRHRYHTIAEAHQRTFHWIFEPSYFHPHDPRSKIRFRDWLVSGHGLYWISGKPGSGKSTLMKYICDAPQTSNCLGEWAGHHRLIRAAFYFWSAGTDMQKCQRGLLQQLLFEILRACPDLIPVLCPHRWEGGSGSDWSLRELQAAFEKLEALKDDTKICFFIDGLDEYDGDESEIIQILQHIARLPHIKLCVSSRPWPCFEDAFGLDAVSKLYLHNLTVDDIRQFARDKLEDIPGSGLLKQEHQAFADLISKITRRAHGVFLWVFLVVRSLRKGVENGDNIPLLLRRLEEMPSDLGPFFDKLIQSVDSVYREQMATMFEVAIRAPEPMCILTYWFLDEGSYSTQNELPPPDLLRIIALEDQMNRRLSVRYKGLLEAAGVPGARKVNFIHRTVRDYLQWKGVHRLLARQDSQAATKASRALAMHAEYCSRSKSGRGFNSQDFAYFLVFARWAAAESGYFDWALFKKVEEHQTGAFDDSDPHILVKTVHYGFTAYLEYRLSQDRTLIHRLSKHLLRAAFDIQSWRVNSTFGIQSSCDTLSWLLHNGADPNVRTTNDTLFAQFLSETGAAARRSTKPWAYEQWKRSLSILLRHGAKFDEVFDDSRFIEALPQIGISKNGGIYDLADTVLLKGEPLRQGLHRHLDIYALFLENGLDPNRRIGSFTLWQMWLWYVDPSALSSMS